MAATYNDLTLDIRRSLRQAGIEAATLEARELYRLLHPPRGWRKLLPPTLFPPSRDLDDLAAWGVVRRFLAALPSPSR